MSNSSFTSSEFLFRGFDQDTFHKLVLEKIANQGSTIDIICKHQPSFPFRHYIEHRHLFRPGHCHKAFKSSLNPWILDHKLDDFLNIARIYFFRCFDRVHGFPSYSCRFVEIYLIELVLLFLSFLKDKPSGYTVVFACAPCFPDDIALYFAAKYLSINTIIVRRTLLSDIVVLDSSIDSNNNTLYPSPHFESLLQKYSDVRQLLDKRSYWLSFSKSLAENESSARLMLSKKRISPIRRMLMKSDNIVFIKQFLYSLFSSSKQSYFLGGRASQQITYLLRYFQNIRLKIWQNKHTVIPNLSHKFVYFGLHFQPERSTDPDASVFTYQYHAIKLISHYLPSDTILYVKEHPRQLQSPWDLRRLHFRSIKDYDQISSLSNVKFVPPDFDSDSLIDSSVLVISPTGSLAWESLLRGKPSITLGRTWHSSCSASPIFDVDQITKQLDYLLSLHPDDIHTHVNQFLSRMLPYFTESVNSAESALHSSISSDLLASNLCKSLYYISLNYENIS